jgi:hypothetical protein
MPRERYIGYRFITSPPEPVSIVKEDRGRRIVYTDQFVAPRVNRADLSLRIGLIITLVWPGWGFSGRNRNSKLRFVGRDNCPQHPKPHYPIAAMRECTENKKHRQTNGFGEKNNRTY